MSGILPFAWQHMNLSPSPARRAARSPALMEGLESRQLLSVSIADYFPMQFAGERQFVCTTGRTAEQVTLTAESDGAGTAFRLRDPDTWSRAAEYFSMDATGLKLYGKVIRSGGMTIDMDIDEVMILPAQVELGGKYSFSTGLSFTANSYWSGTFSGTCQIKGIKTITVPAGTFQALEISSKTVASATSDMGQYTCASTGTLYWALGVGQVRSQITAKQTLKGQQRSSVSIKQDMQMLLPSQLSGPPAVDLVISAVGKPTARSVSFTVTNAGSQALPVGQAAEFAVYLRPVGTNGSSNDIEVETVFTQAIGKLGAGKSKKITVPLSLLWMDDGYNGQYKAVVVADNTDLLAEVSESNNTGVSTDILNYVWAGHYW